MNRFLRALFRRRARFSRLGTLVCLLAVIGWETFHVVTTHHVGSLKEQVEFLAGAAAVFYGIDHFAGHLDERDPTTKE